MASFAALGGVPRQVLYDRMKTAVIGEDDQAHIIYNRALIDCAGHYGFHPKACWKTAWKSDPAFGVISVE